MLFKIFVVFLVLTNSFGANVLKFDSRYFHIIRGGGHVNRLLADYRGLNTRNDLIYTKESCIFGLSRHHIIPYNTLRDFFNKASDRSVIDQRTSDKLYTFYEKLIDSLGQRVRAIDVHEDIANCAVTHGSESVCKTFPNLPQASPNRIFPKTEATKTIEIIKSTVAWMPFNLFDGPSGTNRMNDPGYDFENDAASIVGATKFAKLKSIFDGMRTYVRNSNVDVFGRVIDEILPELDSISYNHFQEYQWQYVEKKRVDKEDPETICVFNIKPT